MITRLANNSLLLIVIAFSVLAIAAVLLLTNNNCITNYFVSKGEIGDTIGGITAPIIGLLNAILLFVTLRKQDKEIKRQAEQREDDKFDYQFDRRSDQIRLSISALTYTLKMNNPARINKSTEYRGGRGLIALQTFFDSEEPIIRKYKPIGSAWVNFIVDANNLLIDVVAILVLNINSKQPQAKKKQNFDYVTRIAMPAILGVQVMVNFRETYPNDPVVGKFGMDRISGMEELIRQIASLSPIEKA